MAALPEKTYHVRHYVQTDDSVPRLFDLYYKGAGTPTAQQNVDVVQACALAARDAMAGAMSLWLAGDSRYLGCTVHYYGSNAAVWPAQEINFDGEVGELSGDTQPDYSAAVIRRYTDQPTPAGRGRIFIPAVAEINTDTSRLNVDGNAALDAIQVVVETPIDLDSTLADEILTPAHWNRKEGTVDQVYLWIGVRTLVTQRRRRLRPLQ